MSKSKSEVVERMIVKELSRNRFDGLDELFEFWDITGDDFEQFMTAGRLYFDKVVKDGRE